EVYDESLEKIQALIRKLDDLIASADKGRILQDGAALAIVGKPNVGKSSLLNRLLREARAIVTEIPGTTRDVVEALANIGGVPVRAFDTAGIRPTTDMVERIGIERARDVILQADILLVILDGSQPLTEEDRLLISECSQKRAILVVNKIDLPQLTDEASLAGLMPGAPLVRISSLTGEGLPELEEEIAAMLLGGEILVESITVANLRQVQALAGAAAALRAGREAVIDGQPAEITAVDLRDAADALGEITGETTTEDVIDKIFSDFCIGK
ncbi:MAG: GTP-binding protein, partial [bacterium]|nr:GTP-binding protein [bacterium]